MPLIRDAVIVYMKTQGGPLCATCLSKALHVPLDRTIDAFIDVRHRGDVPSRSGAQCSRCGLKADVLIPLQGTSDA